MSQDLVLDIMKDALITTIVISGPVLLIALLVGMLISILQATTQVQEQTLTFVPKILAVFISLFIFGSFMLNTLMAFTDRIFSHITNIIQ